MEHDAAFYFALSQTNFREERAEQALADLDEAIRLAPDNLEYLSKRAELRYEAEEHELIVEDYSRIIALNRDFDSMVEAYTRIAFSHEALGRYDDLVDDLNWIIDHGEGRATTYSWRGHHKYRKELFDEALQDHTEAYLLSSHEDCLLQCAQCLYQLKRYEEAVQDLTKIFEEYDNHPNYLRSIYHWRGLAYYRQGKHAEALADFNEIMRANQAEPLAEAAAYLRMVLNEW